MRNYNDDELKEIFVEKKENINFNVLNYSGFEYDRYVNNRLSEVKNIINYLNKRNIDFEIEDKENWGKIFVFNLNGKKVFASDFYEINDKPTVYYYSDKYACEECKVNF